jgi:acetolactate synthase I/II/III large subunit
MASMTYTGGQLIVEALRANGVSHVFGVPGESYLPILDALYDVPEIRFVTARQEGGASMMADAWGKLTGKPGICLVTRGPGAANAYSGIHVAAQDSTPMIVLMGQIARSDTDREAFQEVDVKAMFGDQVKWAAQINDAERITEYMARAFATACSGRPGPVVLALPEDVLQASVQANKPIAAKAVSPAPSLMQISELGVYLSAVSRPLLIAGGEGWSASTSRKLVQFSEMWDLPVACAFRCQDRFPNDHANYAGDAGLGINPRLAANIAEADLVIALNTRLGDCTTSSYTLFDIPVPKRHLVHIYPDPEELGRVYQAQLAINSSVANFLDIAMNMRPQIKPGWSDWTRSANRDYREWSNGQDDSDSAFSMTSVIVWLRENLPADAILTNGAGNYTTWLHRFYRHRSYRTQLAPTSGSMGYGLPAAIAAKLAYPDRVVVALAGDGCLQMTIQEMGTIAQNNLNIIVLVVNNSNYGTIRMHQEINYPKRVSGTQLTNPDFVALAQAYGMFAERIESTSEFAPAMERALAANSACLIEIITDPNILTPTKRITN